MPWIELSFETCAEKAAIAETQLLALGALAITFYDKDDNPILEPNPNETPLWDNVRCVGLFEQTPKQKEIKTKLTNLLNTTISETILPEENWQNAHKAHFNPLSFGQNKNLWIYPTNEQDEPSKPEEFKKNNLEKNTAKVILTPGLAFGTGTHPTTGLCLAWLANHPPAELQVIDYGCGSGILALAALCLNAKAVWAIDHDPQAITSTQNNAKLNQIDNTKLKTYLPNELTNQKADLILANILANPLISLAPTFKQHMKSNGQILLTGILETQADAVKKAYAPWFTFSPAIQQDEWVLLVGNRNQHHAQDR